MESYSDTGPTEADKVWWKNLEGDDRPFVVFGDMADFKPPQRRDVLRAVKAEKTVPKKWTEYVLHDMAVKAECPHANAIAEEYAKVVPPPQPIDKWEGAQLDRQTSKQSEMSRRVPTASVDIRGHMGSILKIIVSPGVSNPTPKSTILAARDSMEIASTTRLREKHKRSSDHGKIVLNIGNKIDSMFEESRESFEEEQIEVESPEPRAKNRLAKDEEEEDDIGNESFSVLGSIHNDSLQVINNHVPDQDHQIHHEKICPMEKCQRMQMDDFMNSLPSYMRASPFTHFEQTYEDYEACTPEQLDILKHRIEEKKKKERVTIDVIDENPLSSWTPSAAGVATQTSYDGLTLPPCTCDDVRDESCEINQVYNNMIVAESWKANYLIWVLPTVLLIGLLSIFGVLALFFAIRLYAKLTCGRYREKTRMDGKTVIVTGCTSGIGKETAKELAKRGAKVIMACRSLDKAEKVKDDIIKSTNNPNVVVKKLDLSSFASIRSFAEDINKTEKTLDVLIHNAGYAETFRKEKSEDGIELTMATNHYGPFLLTHLLIDLLKKNSPSRIVIVASSLYRFASMDLDNPNPLTTLPGYLYYMSKEANILFTRELARRLEGTGVTANCLHPGMIDSGIWRNVPAPLSWGLALIIFCFFKTPFQGCQTSIMLAVDDKLSKVNGKYFSDCQESSLSSSASDMGRARKLWEISEKMVKLEEGDPKITV